MGVLTPLAIKIGQLSWLPGLLPRIEQADVLLQRVSSGRVSVLKIAGLPTLNLRVAGRKTGVMHSTPLLCAPSRGGWLIAGSYFGNPKMPVWVLNLRAAETAEIDFDRQRITVRCKEVEGADRNAAWTELVRVWPNFELYEKRTDRRIPVFVLSRA